MWAQAKDPIGSWCKPEDGLFALEEAPRACPHMNTLSNVGMAGPTLSFFFPDLALSMLRTIRSTQRENGDVAQLLGRWADPANPMSYDYQEVISGFCYVSAAYLHWKITGDEAFMKEFYPSVKKALQYSFTQRPDLGPSQIIAMPPHREHAWNDIEWFEDRSMYGYVTHPGGLRMAGAEMLKAWAQAMGDSEEVAYLDSLVAAGKDAMQKYLWKGDHYLIYNDPKTGKTLDAIFSPTLNGQYYAHFTGVPPVFPKENVEKILALQRDKVCKISKLGMPPIYANPDGTMWNKDKTGYLTGAYRLHQSPSDLECHYLHLRRPQGIRAGAAAQEPGSSVTWTGDIRGMAPIAAARVGTPGKSTTAGTIGLTGPSGPPRRRC